MIIDAHAHIGRWEEDNIYPPKMLEDQSFAHQILPEMLIDLMDNSPERIDLALISNLCRGRNCDQSIVNQLTREAVLKYPDRLRGLVWVNPGRPQTGLGSDVDDTKYCLGQLDNEGHFIFVGLKFHPVLNEYDFEEISVQGFLRAAQESKVPVAVHTDFYHGSEPNRVAVVAQSFMDVKFILYHGGLAPPDYRQGMEVLECVAAQENLFIDISWLEYERLERAIQTIPDRTLFGTDVPLGGPGHYGPYFESLGKLNLSDDLKAQLMRDNCLKVFDRLER